MAQRPASGAILSAPQIDSSGSMYKEQGGHICGLMERPTGGNNHQLVKRAQTHRNCSLSALPPQIAAEHWFCPGTTHNVLTCHHQG